jgi:hypothetical protein
MRLSSGYEKVIFSFKLKTFPYSSVYVLVNFNDFRIRSYRKSTIMQNHRVKLPEK